MINNIIIDQTLFKIQKLTLYLNFLSLGFIGTVFVTFITFLHVINVISEWTSIRFKCASV